MKADLHPNQKYCKQCQTWLYTMYFDKKTAKSGKVYFQTYCRRCATRLNTAYKKAKRQRDPEYKERRLGVDRERVRKREAAKRLEALTDPSLLAAILLKDTKKTAKKRGLPHDLSSQQILALVTQPCSYCEDSSLRMSLDRIDNDKGYTVGNLVGACVRCNYMRRDIPYEAWKLFIPILRDVVSKGLLDGWMSGPHNNQRRRLVQAAGIEPTFKASETLVLPLDDA